MRSVRGDVLGDRLSRGLIDPAMYAAGREFQRLSASRSTAPGRRR